MPSPWIFFDAYGTLLEMDDFQGRLHAFFTRKGWRLAEAAVQRAAEAEMRFYMARAVAACDEPSWQELRRCCAGILSATLRDEGYAVPASICLEAIEASIVFRIFDECADVLEELRGRGWRLAVHSNWDYTLGAILQEHQLAEQVELVLVSAECGLQKPSPEFVHHALTRARERDPELSPDECWYVGDNYENDMEPALAAGLRAIWLVREERGVASGEMPEHRAAVPIIRTLRELAKVVTNKHFVQGERGQGL